MIDSKSVNSLLLDGNNARRLRGFDECPVCRSKLRHMHDEAHGISGTHMSGSERYECDGCNNKWFKLEGEELGFEFVLD